MPSLCNRSVKLPANLMRIPPLWVCLPPHRPLYCLRIGAKDVHRLIEGSKLVALFFRASDRNWQDARMQAGKAASGRVRATRFAGQPTLPSSGADPVAETPDGR